LGVIHAKDCFAASVHGVGIASFEGLLRPALKINTSEEALDLLPRFQSGTTHLALVYKDEQLVGFVTLDNLLDALIGKIKDEFHPTKSPSLYTSRKATNNSEHESR
jgi:CBS domain containing-hemolysin-like protein